MSGYTEARMVQLRVMESVLVIGCQSVNWSISCSVLHVRNVKTEIRLCFPPDVDFYSLWMWNIFILCTQMCVCAV